MTQDRITLIKIKADESRLQSYPTLRVGQSLMNSLYTIDKELYKDVMLDGCDPFYDDRKIEAFWNFLKTRIN